MIEWGGEAIGEKLRNTLFAARILGDVLGPWLSEDPIEIAKKEQEGAITPEEIASIDKNEELTQTDFENADEVVTDITKDNYKSNDEI